MSQKNLLKKICLSQGHRGHGRKQRKKNVPHLVLFALNSRLCRVHVYEKCCINLKKVL